MKVDASNITKNLWIGAAPPLDRDIPSIDTLVLCAMEIQPTVMAFHGAIVRCPLDDAELAMQSIATSIVAAKRVASDLMAHKRVLVTCAQGRNRSALVAGLALGMVTRRTPAQIVELIRSRRRRDCLSNPHFVRYLERYIVPERAEVHSARGTVRMRARG